jgi:hypothetical protein
MGNLRWLGADGDREFADRLLNFHRVTGAATLASKIFGPLGSAWQNSTMPLTFDRPLPRIDHTGGWKESQYHPRLGREICARIEAGETVRQVAADPAMPSYATLFRWRKVQPDFEAMYAAMRARLVLGRIERADLAARSKDYWRIHKARVDGRRVRDWVAGRASTYQRAWAQAYCDRIAGGESGMAVSADPAMPSARAIYRWLKRFPEFREMYVEARGIQRFALEMRRDEARLFGGLDLPGGLARRLGMTIDPTTRKRAAWLDGRIGRLGAKTWKALPPAREWAEPPGGGMRAVKASAETSS